MQANNIFSFTRFGMLFRQSLIHNYRMILLSGIGFCGGLFILLFLIQFGTDFRPLTLRNYEILFMMLFSGLGIICAGTAFPDFRRRERALNYLLIPASPLEKFLLQFGNRVVLFVVITPALYWLVYNVEGNVIKIFYPHFSFESQLYLFPRPHPDAESLEGLIYTAVFSVILLMLVIPFTGASAFSRQPIIKTLFSLATIFFFNLFVAYVMFKVLGLQHYHPDSSAGILFVVHGAEDVFYVVAISAMLMSIGLLTAAYFKLKEKEV
ncbi:MAG: hypothetical protein WEB30_02875 [Cyclobacteriaceae bacterium]